MPVARLFVDRLPDAGQKLRLSSAEASHARARRLALQDAVVLFDGAGLEAAGRIVGVSRSAVEVTVERILDRDAAESPITLYVAAVRAERLSWIAEKATELGAARLILVHADRAQAFRGSEALTRRLERVALAAAKQCGSARGVRVEGPLPFAEALALETARHRYLLDPAGEPFPTRLPPGDGALAIGPEGGWTDREVAKARDLGWAVAGLPAGRLRAETAAVSGLILLRSALAQPADNHATSV